MSGGPATGSRAGKPPNEHDAAHGHPASEPEERDPEPPAPDVVVLDVGEVLIDETRVWATWAEMVGVSPLTFASVLGAAIVQGGDVADAFEHVAPNVDWQELIEEHERRYGGFTPDDLYPDAAPCLADLVDASFTVVLAGNQPAHRADQLATLGLRYHHLLLSAQLGVSKPDERFFAAVLEGIGVDDPGRALYVGDRVDNDVIAAAEAGWRTCWLRRGPWGTLQDLADGLAPDLSLEGLAELPVLLAAWRDGTG